MLGTIIGAPPRSAAARSHRAARTSRSPPRRRRRAQPWHARGRIPSPSPSPPPPTCARPRPPCRGAPALAEARARRAEVLLDQRPAVTRGRLDGQGCFERRVRQLGLAAAQPRLHLVEQRPRLELRVGVALRELTCAPPARLGAAEV